MATTLLDVRDALRAVRREPVYAGAVIATLALTLGASTAVFSIVNGVVLRPLAYHDARLLVSIREVVPGNARRYATHPVNARHFEEWRRQATSFASIAEVEWRATNPTRPGGPGA